MTLARKLGRPATREDLEAVPPPNRAEIIDGELYVQARPRPLHAAVEGAIHGDLLGPFQRGIGGPGGWWIIIEPGIEAGGSPEFSPDLAGWRRQRLAALPRDEPFRIVPDWICEILSPTARSYDTLKKRPFYARLGVSWLWFVNPEARTLTVSRLDQGAWVEAALHGEDERARLPPFEDVEVDLAVWWP
jgi:Uma2 family endonuclease